MNATARRTRTMKITGRCAIGNIGRVYDERLQEHDFEILVEGNLKGA